MVSNPGFFFGMSLFPLLNPSGLFFFLGAAFFGPHWSKRGEERPGEPPLHPGIIFPKP